MEQHRENSRIVVFSDYVCPFCYLGKASLEKYLAQSENPPDVDWHVFDLQGYRRGPNGRLSQKPGGGKDESYFARVKENVRRLRDEYDVDMSVDIRTDIDSWKAQKLSIYAREHFDGNVFGELHDALFDALWKEERDIGATEVLADIGEAAGIPASDVKTAITDDGLDDELEKQFAEAKALGINAVPTFSYSGRFVQGAVPPDRIARFIDDDQQIDLRSAFN